ncbi:MAG TPA: anti-sigma factor [Solirubrobacteraceae bacterium]|jgi:anti-sigma-K factor RskA
MNDRAPSGDQRGCGNDAAPFVLGALEPADARSFARHMESCAICRDEVSALEPVLDVLPLSAPRYEVSAALRRRVMQQIRSELKPSSPRPRRRVRRRPRWMLPVAVRFRPPAIAGALVVALALVVAVVAVGHVVLGPAGSRARVIMASVGSAQLRVSGGRGELIVDHLPPAPPDRIYELWLQRGARDPAPSTLFAVTSRGTADIGVPGELVGVTRVLVTVEPLGGSRAPTTRAVISARLA